jgi:hypothetical protein
VNNGKKILHGSPEVMQYIAYCIIYASERVINIGKGMHHKAKYLHGIAQSLHEIAQTLHNMTESLHNLGQNST